MLTISSTEDGLSFGIGAVFHRSYYKFHISWKLNNWIIGLANSGCAFDVVLYYVQKEIADRNLIISILTSWVILVLFWPNGILIEDQMGGARARESYSNWLLCMHLPLSSPCSKW